MSNKQTKNLSSSSNFAAAETRGAAAQPPIRVTVRDFPDDAPVVLTHYDAAPTFGLTRIQRNSRETAYVCVYHSFNTGSPNGCEKGAECRGVHLNDASSCLFHATGDHKYKGDFFDKRSTKRGAHAVHNNFSNSSSSNNARAVAFSVVSSATTTAATTTTKSARPFAAAAANQPRLGVIPDEDDDGIQHQHQARQTHQVHQVQAQQKAALAPPPAAPKDANLSGNSKASKRKRSSSAAAREAPPPIHVRVKDFPDDPSILLTQYDAEMTGGLHYAHRKPENPVFICPHYSFNTGPTGCIRSNCHYIHLNAASSTLFKATGDAKFKERFFVKTNANANGNGNGSNNKSNIKSNIKSNNGPAKIEVALKDRPDDEPIVLRESEFTAEETSGLKQVRTGEKPCVIVCPYFSFNASSSGLCAKGKSCGYLHLYNAARVLYKATGDDKFKMDFYVRRDQQVPPVAAAAAATSSSQQNKSNNNINTSASATMNKTTSKSQSNRQESSSSLNSVENEYGASASFPALSSIDPRPQGRRPENHIPYEPARRAAAQALTKGDQPKKQELTYEVGLDDYWPRKDKFDSDTFPRTKAEAMDRKYRGAADLPSVRKNLNDAGARPLKAEDFAHLSGLHPTSHQLSFLKPSRFRHLLHMRQWTDEVKCQIDLLQFSQEAIHGRENIEIPRGSPHLVSIRIPGVAESRPSVMRGDQILCSVHGDDRWDGGFVHYVNTDRILVSFHSSAPIRNPAKMYSESFDIQFTFGQRTSLRSVHRAIDVGTQLTKKVVESMDQPFSWKVGGIVEDSRISNCPLNDEQREFVQLVAEKSALLICDGFPGTGKTATVCAAILALVLLGRENRARIKILVTCPTNAAADLIVERIHEVIDKWEQGKRPSMLRVHALNREVKHTSDIVQKYSDIDRAGDQFLFPEKADINIVSIVVCTLASAGRMYSRGVQQNHFTHVFVDEAGQVTEEEMMLATTFVPDPRDLKNGERATSLILAGDHRQLGPIVHAGICREAGMTVSALERLRDPSVTPPENVIQLKRNYRSHPAIVNVVNVTYNDQLIPSRQYRFTGFQNHQAPLPTTDVSLMQLPWYSTTLRSKFSDPDLRALSTSFAQNPVLFLHNEGKESRDEENVSPSWQNTSERSVVVDLVRVLVTKCKKRCTDITILTPYILQRKKIESTIHFHCFIDQNPATRIELTDEERFGSTYMSNTGKVSFKCPIQVCTVESFQGKENKIIIVSCVRSQEAGQLGSDVRHALGFMAQPQRTNVAVSRAQDAMIIIGNAKIFLRDPARFNGSNTYDRADSSTFGLWDGILGRIASYHGIAAPRAQWQDHHGRSSNDYEHDHNKKTDRQPLVPDKEIVISNFVNLANPQESFDDIRVLLGRLAYDKNKNTSKSKNKNDDDDDEVIDDTDRNSDDSSSNECLPTNPNEE